MKKIFVLFFVCISLNSFSQAQWKFYVAFEDATGAKDTLWMIYDTTAYAMLPTDTILGEGKMQFDYSKFNVWILNYDFDSTKTTAMPYFIFPNHALYNIDAMNFQYPILITWDTSLFHSTILPNQPDLFINLAQIDNDYFFFVSNDPSMHTYNMLIIDSALAPAFSFGAQSHFPMNIHFSYDPSIGINDIENEISNVKIYPIPFDAYINISSKLPIEAIDIQTIEGRIIIKSCLDKSSSNNYKINTEGISKGLYFLSIKQNKKKTVHKLIIK